MAKLGAYYGLCPLIDHRSLLGICPDEEKGVVLVTLGKNIAAKYKVNSRYYFYTVCLLKCTNSFQIRSKFLVGERKKSSVLL
jgi:hypothetical protein